MSPSAPLRMSARKYHLAAHPLEWWEATDQAEQHATVQAARAQERRTTTGALARPPPRQVPTRTDKKIGQLAATVAAETTPTGHQDPGSQKQMQVAPKAPDHCRPRPPKTGP